MDFYTLLLGLVFVIANPWAFFELRRSASAHKERLKHANEELAGLIESHIFHHGLLPKDVVFEAAAAIARKRDLKVAEVYKPIVLLHEVLQRIRSNPVLNPEDRGEYETAVRAVMIGLKRTEGVQLLEEAIEAVEGSAVHSERNRARKIIGRVSEDWATFDDQAAMARLRHLRTRLGFDSERANAVRVLSEMNDRWVRGREHAGTNGAKAEEAVGRVG